jgi:hypothetical protein
MEDAKNTEQKMYIKQSYELHAIESSVVDTPNLANLSKQPQRKRTEFVAHARTLGAFLADLFSLREVEEASGNVASNLRGIDGESRVSVAPRERTRTPEAASSRSTI